MNKKGNSKRPSSANATLRKIKLNEQQNSSHHTNQTIPQHYASSEDDEFLASCRIMSRDDLLVALHTTKKKLTSNEVIISQLKTDNQRLESELLKQQRRIDRLLESMSGGKGNIHGAEIRKEIEKSILVRQLKQQIVILRNNMIEKEQELETQRKSMKSSKLMELLCENHEYSLEVTRLREIIKQNQYSTQENKKEKKHKHKNESENINTTTVMMSKTVAGTGITGGPDIKKSTATSSPNQLGRMIRPQSASATSNTQRTLVQDMLLQSNANDNSNSFTGPSLAELANRQIAPTTIIAPPSATTITTTTNNIILNNNNNVVLNNETMKNTFEPVKIPNITTFKVGDKVQGRFRGGGDWFDATIKTLLDDNLYHLVYDDGDEETGVSEDKIRKKEIDLKANNMNTNTNNTKRSNTPVSIKGKFNVGDKIEAQYYNGTTWYEGKIAGLVYDGDVIKYDIIYSDGDREKAVIEEKIRLISESLTTTNAKVPPIQLAMPDTTTTTTNNNNNNSSSGINNKTTNNNSNKENSQNNNDNDKNFSKYLDDLSDDEDNNGLSSGRGVYGVVDDNNDVTNNDDMNNEGNYDEDFDA